MSDAVGALLYLLAEVAVSGGLGARYHGHALHHGRHEGLAVHVPHAVRLQPADRLLPLALHVAQGVGGVDVVDAEREAVEFVVGDGRPHEDADAGGQALPGLRLEAGREGRKGRTPHHGPRLGGRHAVRAALLDQLHVTVARIIDLDFGDLGADPHGQRKPLVERVAHEALQFG